jgi:hypothetical protein
MDRNHCRRHLAAIVALLGIGAVVPLTAQSVPTVSVGKRTGRSRYSFGHIEAARPLPDGRVVASDSKSNFFRIVDYSHGGDVTTLGVQGEDSDMYRSAGMVLSFGGDSLLLQDAAGRKYLRVTPQGTISGTDPIPQAGNRPFFGTPAALDSAGNLYFVHDSFDFAKRVPIPTADIDRVPLAGGSAQRVAEVQVFRPDQAGGKGIMPYPYRDAWALRSDGLAARVEADTYQVIWSRDGHEIGRTGPLPYQPVPIDAAEQQAFRDSAAAAMQSMARQMSQVIASGGRGQGGSGTSTTMMGAPGGAVFVTSGSGSDGPPPLPPPGAGGGGRTMVFVSDGSAPTTVSTSGDSAGRASVFDPATLPIAAFPADKPPITSAWPTAIFAPDGMLWIARSRAHDDHTPLYDVVAEGRGLVARVTLPDHTRLVGFGRDGLYLAHADGDQEYLERYAMPKF